MSSVRKDNEERRRGVSELTSLPPSRILFSKAHVSVSSFSQTLVLKLMKSPDMNSHQSILREEDIETRAKVLSIPTGIESHE